MTLHHRRTELLEDLEKYGLYPVLQRLLEGTITEEEVSSLVLKSREEVLEEIEKVSETLEFVPSEGLGDYTELLEDEDSNVREYGKVVLLFTVVDLLQEVSPDLNVQTILEWVRET